MTTTAERKYGSTYGAAVRNDSAFIRSAYTPAVKAPPPKPVVKEELIHIPDQWVWATQGMVLNNTEREGILKAIALDPEGADVHHVIRDHYCYYRRNGSSIDRALQQASYYWTNHKKILEEQAVSKKELEEKYRPYELSLKEIEAALTERVTHMMIVPSTMDNTLCTCCGSVNIANTYGVRRLPDNGGYTEAFIKRMYFETLPLDQTPSECPAHSEQMILEDTDSKTKLVINWNDA